MRYRILPYRQGSKSAKALAEELGGKVLKLEGSKYVQRGEDVAINWGHAEGGGGFLNPSYLIRRASNKREFFLLMKEVGCEDIIPRFFINPGDITEDAFPIVCRTVLAGHSGVGIVISPTRDDLVPAPLYVEYVKKAEEYRVHVGKKGDGSVIAVQRKARRHDVPDSEVNWQIRNHSNGFVFVRQDVNPPSAVIEAAKKALEVTELDFGAVDVIWNQQAEKAYVLEINTAPGLEGQTVKDYGDFFRSLQVP